MKKILFTFSIMQNCDEIVFLIPFRLVTSRRRQILELESECNRLLLAQERLERMESSHLSSPCSVGTQSNSSYHKRGEWRMTQLVALILFLTSPLMTKPSSESFTSRNAEAMFIASYVLSGTVLLMRPGPVLPH